MDKIIISPAKYIQGNGSLDNIATYAAILGTEPLIIADEFVTGLVGDSKPELCKRKYYCRF